MEAELSRKKLVTPTFSILIAISIGHFINDSMQAVVPAIFPILEKELQLSYTQIGLIAFLLNMTSSVLQPILGRKSDRHPKPFMLPIAMLVSGVGMICIAFAPTYGMVLLAALLIGFGSAFFHPEGSKVAYLAAGNQRGLAQAIYQVGGNFGNALAPLFTVVLFLPFGQKGSLFVFAIALIGVFVLSFVSKWYQSEIIAIGKKEATTKEASIDKRIIMILGLIIFVTFVRSWYGAGIGNYYQFYLIKDYGLSIKHAQYLVFAYMFAGVIGTFIGGPLSDRIGKRNLLVGSLVLVIPFAFILPYLPLGWVIPIFIFIGLVLNSSFSVLVVYTQELLPGHIATVSGLIVGLAFGLGAVGAVVLGKVADVYSLKVLMVTCSVLPLLGMVSFLLPNDRKHA